MAWLPGTEEPGVGDAITIRVSVRNTGSRNGSEVFQVYINDVGSSLPAPVKKLYRFQKIMLEPGEAKTLSFTIPVSELGLYTDSPGKIVEKGVFMVTVGGLTACFTVR